jgi:hypothetical protein
MGNTERRPSPARHDCYAFVPTLNEKEKKISLRKRIPTQFEGKEKNKNVIILKLMKNNRKLWGKTRLTSLSSKIECCPCFEWRSPSTCTVNTVENYYNLCWRA